MDNVYITLARPQYVECFERDEERFSEFEGVQERAIVVPQCQADRNLARIPLRLERPPGQQVPSRFTKLSNGILDALRDLVLIVHCYTLVKNWLRFSRKILTPLFCLSTVKGRWPNIVNIL